MSPPQEDTPPQKDPPFPSSPAHSLFFSAQFFAACLFLVCPSLSVHLAIPSTAADSHRGSLTRWVLLPSCFTGEETGAERGQENVPRPGGGQERNAGYPAQVCPEPEPQRGARRLRQDSGSPQGALHPGAAEASSPPVSRHKPGAQGVAGRRRAWGPSAGTARQLHPSVVGLPRALPGDDFRRGCSTWGLCQAARRGGAGNGVLTAPQEESGSVSARGRQNAPSFLQGCTRSVVMETKRLRHRPPGYPPAVLSLAWAPCALQHACGWRYPGDIGRNLVPSCLPAARPGREGLTSDVRASLTARSGHSSRTRACHRWSHHGDPAAHSGAGK